MLHRRAASHNYGAGPIFEPHPIPCVKRWVFHSLTLPRSHMSFLFRQMPEMETHTLESSNEMMSSVPPSGRVGVSGIYFQGWDRQVVLQES